MDAPCVAPSRVTQKIFAVLVEWYHHIDLTVTFKLVSFSHHRLHGSASPALTATHHSYGSPRLSDFFPSRFWGSDPSTDINAKWLKRRVFTQGCAFCSKSRYFHTPISRPPKRSKFGKFLDEFFDRWRHVTQKGQGHDLNIFGTHYLDSGWRYGLGASMEHL